MLPRTVPEVWSLDSCFSGEAVGSEGWSAEAECFVSASSLGMRGSYCYGQHVLGNPSSDGPWLWALFVKG